MNNYFLLIPIAAAIILVVSIIMKKMEWFLNFFLRICVGTIALYIAGNLMVQVSAAAQVGINVVTVLTIGLLGLPGFCLVLFLDLYYLYG